ncbi:Alternative oxidase, mitochondrial [Cryomyces minteri]|uniref:Alternative oxidase n=1 Tax=Cryomyces minteri TaxID=331657 RepID=A0A4U0XLZ2_9PEZI|nr:Alternative oxidase, mitochondrial [Cryomyces minteri]
MTKRITYKVEGEVQGVNFRSYTVKQANSLGVTGFVKNASDGTVVGEAQGDESKLQEFVKHLNSGPSAASVNKVDHSDIEVKQGEKGFSHYTEQQMKDVAIAHRDAKSWSDWSALSAVRILRWGLDLATGYKHDKAVSLGKKDPKDAKRAFAMSERKYLIRNIFLESVAGVPGMVAGMLRHLHSMRRMKRDNGWIETLLEESYNERMHLLTFLQMAEPGWFMRIMVLGAQGVFFNSFFIAYLVSPRTCHRFVGYLEEEAVLTYTRELADLEAGRLPKWEKLAAPEIAVKYWKMPEGHRTMRDLLLYIRADEAKHREVNHTLGNLDQKNDPNPYVSKYKDDSQPHPTKGIEYLRPTGWNREDVI